MFIALVLLILWPVAELLVAIKVAQLIGVLDTVLLLVISWPVGVWAMRSQGRAVWRRLTGAVSIGRTPGREVLDGALVLIGGMLLILPGFIGDVIGAWLLIPQTRSMVRRPLTRLMQGRVLRRAARATRRAARRAYDVDSTATDIEQPRLGH
jgi:UPF0716 protein FxsA